MKKGKYIDTNVIMACLSHNKPKQEQSINELLSSAFGGKFPGLRQENKAVNIVNNAVLCVIDY